MQLQMSLLLLSMSEHLLAPLFLQLLPTSCDTITSGAMWMTVSSTGAPSGTV